MKAHASVLQMKRFVDEHGQGHKLSDEATTAAIEESS